MPKLTKTVVDKAEPRDRQYTVWCSELKGLGAFVLPSGTRTYFVDYRNANNVRRRMKLGRHGAITAEQARTLAIQALAKVAKGNDPLEDRNSARKAISVKELCELYIAELEAGRILGKGGRPKKASTKITDLGRITRHIIPLLGSKCVTHVTKADVTAMMKDIMAGKTRATVKTKKLRGKSIVRGGLGAASRTVGLLGGIFSYARDELGIIEANPAHGVRKPKDAVRKRRLNEEEYRTLGRILAKAADDERYARTVDIIRLIAMSGCRRGEIIEAKKSEIDTVGSAFRFEDTKEGQSVRPIGLPIVEYFDDRGMDGDSSYVFPGERNRDGPFGSFPRHWEKIFAGTELADLTAHVLRHSFASLANDLGFAWCDRLHHVDARDDRAEVVRRPAHKREHRARPEADDAGPAGHDTVLRDAAEAYPMLQLLLDPCQLDMGETVAGKYAGGAAGVRAGRHIVVHRDSSGMGGWEEGGARRSNSRSARRRAARSPAVHSRAAR